jgi:hypothetical protein
MITSILIAVLITVLGVGIMYATSTFVKNELVKNVLLVGEILGLIVILLRYFKQI